MRRESSLREAIALYEFATVGSYDLWYKYQIFGGSNLDTWESSICSVVNRKLIKKIKISIE